MNRALPFLFLTLFTRRALQQYNKLRQPENFVIFCTLAWVIGFFVSNLDSGFLELLTQQGRMAMLMSVLLIGGVFGGIYQRSVGFKRVDVQYIFSGPFSFLEITLFFLVPPLLISCVVGVVFFGLYVGRLPSPVAAALGVGFCQAIAFNLKYLVTCAMNKLAAKWCRFIRVITLIVLGGGLCLGVGMAIHNSKTKGGLDGWSHRFTQSNWTKVVLFPAVATAELGERYDFEGKAKLLAGMGAVYLASVILLLCVNRYFLGDMIGAGTANSETSGAARLTKVQPAFAVSRGGAVPRSRIFQGAGAIVWKHLLGLQRSRRKLIGAGVFSLLVTLPCAWILIATASEQDPFLISFVIPVCIGILPLLLQRVLPFDFSRDARHMPQLKTLPCPGSALVAAELAVPVGTALFLQGLCVAGLCLLGPVPRITIVLMAAAFPATTMAVFLTWNIAYLNFAPVDMETGERLNSGSSLGNLLAAFLCFGAFLPTGWTFYILRNSDSLVLAGLGAITVQCVVDLLMFIFLTRLFKSPPAK